MNMKSVALLRHNETNDILKPIIHGDVYKRQGLCHHIVVGRSYWHYNGCRKTMLSDKQIKSSRAPQLHERQEKERRPKCYNCRKHGHLQVDHLEKKIPREESDCTNWRNEDPEQHIVSTLHKTSGNLIVNGFA